MSPIVKTVAMLVLLPTFDSPKVAKARLPIPVLFWQCELIQNFLSQVVTFLTAVWQHFKRPHV